MVSGNDQVRKSRTLSVAIRRTPQDVYDFVSNPKNLPQWAKGLGGTVKETGTGWVIETSAGTASIRFATSNNFGVLDHYVSPAPGIEIYVPMRVVANGTGSEVIFTLFRQPEMDDAHFAADQALVESDLQTLKKVLEDGRAH